MDGKRTFEKYYSRLAREGVIKSIIFGLTIGFGASFIAALITWICAVDGLWISIALWAATAAAISPIAYVKLFRPTAKSIARRIDKLGLEERLITMTELENDSSYMAMRQREDAKSALSGVDAKSIKFGFSRKAIIIVSVLAAFAVAMTCISALSARGRIAGAKDFFDDLLPGGVPDFLELNYVVEGGGSIEGEEAQIVSYGENGTPVLAVADDGWVFAGWNDGYPEPYREDYLITENTTFTAVFEQMPDDQEENPSDSPDQPEENPEEQETPPPEANDDPDDNDNSDNQQYGDNNSIIDGNTYYRDKYEEYLQRAMEMLENGEDLPAELRELLEAYYNIIA